MQYRAYAQKLAQEMQILGDIRMELVLTGMKDEQKHRLLETAATVLSSEVETARLGESPNQGKSFPIWRH